MNATLLRMARLGIVLPTLAFCGRASAQTSSDAARAESLFHEARDLMDAKDYERACPALEESLRLDRAVGTLLNLARCYEMAGRVASAWSTFSEAEGEARRQRQTKRSELARENKQRLAPLVPRLVVQLVDVSVDARVSLDGVLLGRGALNLPLAIDAGKHEISIEQPGMQTLVHAFEVEAVKGNAAPQKLTVGPLSPVDQVEAPAPASTASQAGGQEEPTSAERGASSNKGMRWAGGLMTGVGVIGVGVGLTLSFIALGQAKRADCDENLDCSSEGVTERDEARRLLMTGYGVTIGGGVVGATGVTLLALSFRGKDQSAQLRSGVLGRTPVGLQVVGSF